MYEVQMTWGSSWLTLQRGFKSREDAQWMIAYWRSRNYCQRCPFRVAVAGQEVAEPAPASQCEDGIPF